MSEGPNTTVELPSDLQCLLYQSVAKILVSWWEDYIAQVNPAVVVQIGYAMDFDWLSNINPLRTQLGFASVDMEWVNIQIASQTPATCPPHCTSIRRVMYYVWSAAFDAKICYLAHSIASLKQETSRTVGVDNTYDYQSSSRDGAPRTASLTDRHIHNPRL